MEEVDAIAPLKKGAIVAANHAADVMAKLTGQEITATAPTVQLVAVEEVLAKMNDIASISSVIVIKIQGDVQGLLVLSINPADAQLVVQDTIKQLAVDTYNDQEQAVLCEVANIVAGAMLNSIAKFFDLRLMQSPPVGVVDMLGAALDPFLAEFGTRFDKVLIQQDVFTIPARAVNLRLLAIIDPLSTDRMLKKVINKGDTKDARNH